MLVINHLGLRPALLNPTHQNSKPFLMSRYTRVTHILCLKYTPWQKLDPAKQMVVLSQITILQMLHISYTLVVKRQ